LSLLLDALKEAQKQRQSEGHIEQVAAKSPGDNAEGELEFELELDLDNVSEPESDSSNTPLEPTETAGNVTTEPSQADANLSNSDNTSTSEPAIPVSTPTQREPVSAPTLNKTDIKSPHSANAVFRNRSRLKKKGYLLLVLLIALLSLLTLGAYLFFLTESFSPPAQAVSRRQNINQLVKPPLPKPQVNAFNEATSSTAKPVTAPVMTAVVPKVLEPQTIAPLQHGVKAATVIAQSAASPAMETELESEGLSQSPADAFDGTRSVGKGSVGKSSEEPFAGIKIRKRQIPAEREISLRRAQQSLSNGDLATAELNFSSVLKKSPANVVALLGMANLSAIKAQPDQAQLYFQRVLAQSPQNLVARAGLLSLANSSSLDVGSALQQLVRSSPEQAFLHASLGDYYLKRSEWPAAQAAYFDAFSRDPKNANYAYNLAISLDQMAKPKLALQFYQQALSLEKSRSAHFDKAVLVARITVLKAAQ